MSTPLVSPSVQSMLQRVRTLLKQPDPANSNWSDTELLDHLNEAVRVYFAELTSIDEGHFVVSTTLNITANQETVALPSDCFKVKALWKVTNQENIMLSYRNNLTESYSTNSGTSSNLFTPYYYFRGNNLVLRPIPGFSETGGLLLEYMQFPETLLNGSDTLTAQISPIFRQVVEAYAVYMAKFTESLVTGTDTYSIAERRLSDLIKQFRDINAERSKNPTYVQPFNPEG